MKNLFVSFFISFSLFFPAFSADYSMENVFQNRGCIITTLSLMKEECETCTTRRLSFTKRQNLMVKSLIRLHKLTKEDEKTTLKTPLFVEHLADYAQALDDVEFDRENTENAFKSTIPATSFHTPTKVHNSTYYLLRGISPDPKRTPRRINNLERMWEGRSPVHVELIPERRVYRTEQHHLSQNSDDTIVDLPVEMHKGMHKRLHRRTGSSQIDRKKYARETRRARKSIVLKELIHWLENMTEENKPSFKKILKVVPFPSLKHNPKQSKITDYFFPVIDESHSEKAPEYPLCFDDELDFSFFIEEGVHSSLVDVF